MRQPPASPDNIDIKDLFRSIKRRTIMVAIASALAALLTYAAVSMMAPQFVSQSELTIRAKGTTNPFAGPRGDGGSSQALASQVDKEAVNTHVRALQSPDLAAKLAEQLKLNRSREFNGALGPEDAMGRMMLALGLGGYDKNESEHDRVMRAFFDRLEVFSPAESRIITVAFSSSDPQLAADVANVLAKSYRERLANATVVETDSVQKALEPKIAQLMKEVGAAEGEVAQYRAKSGLLRGGAQKTPLSQQQLGDLTTELTRASAARSSLQASAATARDLIRRGNPEVIPQVQRSPLIQNLIQQRVQVERDLRKFSATMKGAHPVIRQLNADLSSVKRQVAFEVANVVASLDKEALSAVEREASIARSLEAIKGEVADKSDEEVELGRLMSVATSKRAELVRLRAQFEANRARADSGVVPVEAEIVTVARPASIALYPKKGTYTVLAAAATFLFGMALVVTSALLNGARPEAGAGAAKQFRNDIASVAGLPVPELQTGGGVAVGSSGIRTIETPAELSSHLKTLENIGDGSCRTLIVSNDARQAAGWLAREVGTSLSMTNANAIMIDWSTRGDGILLRGNVSSPEAGMMDLLNGTARFGDVVHTLPGGKTHVISGGTPMAAGKKLDPEHLNMVLDALDSAYGHIILVSTFGAAKELFETIQGRIDAGVIVGPAQSGVKPGSFLGFSVEGVSVLQMISSGPGRSAAIPVARKERTRANDKVERGVSAPA